MSLDPGAQQVLVTYNYPGNVRELENKIKTAVIMADGAMITGDDLGLSVEGEVTESLNLREVRCRAESEAVRQALAATSGNVSKAAELLGVTRPTLYDLMQRNDITGPA